MGNMSRVHKINPVGVGKGGVPLFKNYLWKIAYVANLSRSFWGIFDADRRLRIVLKIFYSGYKNRVIRGVKFYAA